MTGSGSAGESGSTTAPPRALVEAAQQLLGAEARPLSGGYSGETFLVGVAGEEAVLRLYAREPTRAAVDAALFTLVRDLVPVPHVLDLRAEPSAPGAPAHLLMERLPGVRMDLWLPGATPDLRRAAGESAGRVLARLSGIPFLRAGRFVGPELRVEPWAGDSPGSLDAWVEAHRHVGAFATWSETELGALVDVAGAGQELLDTEHRVCLAHSDVNPKNLLVDAGTGEVTGLIDWEYAHAGSPYTDLGNLLRFETDEAFCRGVVETFAALAPGVSPRFVELGRAMDLLALVDLASRAGENPVTEQAARLLRETARTRDLGAGRPSWS